MLIQCDAEGKQAMHNLFHVALKAGGMESFKEVVKIMDSVKDIPEEKDPVKPDKK